jgi:hypothetical protein
MMCQPIGEVGGPNPHPAVAHARTTSKDLHSAIRAFRQAPSRQRGGPRADPAGADAASTPARRCLLCLTWADAAQRAEHACRAERDEGAPVAAEGSDQAARAPRPDVPDFEQERARPLVDADNLRRGRRALRRKRPNRPHTVSTIAVRMRPPRSLLGSVKKTSPVESPTLLRKPPDVNE